MKAKDIPESAKDRLSYDPDTGKLKWVQKNKYHPRMDGKEAGSNKNGYLKIKLNGESYSAHRIAWFLYYDAQPASIIDHINGVTTDNRIVNLRETDDFGNTRNHGKLNCGASENLYGRFRSRITFNKKCIHLGTFSTREEAEKVYIKKRKELFKEFHRKGTTNEAT